MKTLYLFPSSPEAEYFRELCPAANVVIIGVGMVSAAASTARAIVAQQPSRVVLCGIAGAFDHCLAIGEVVEVVSDRVCGLPTTFDREYLVSASTSHRAVSALTVSRTGESLPFVKEASTPCIEQMEGAAVAAMAEAFGVEYMHLRAISNRVNDERAQWRIREAVESLSKAVAQLFTE